MPAAEYLVHENIWTDKAKYDDAERQYYERLTKVGDFHKRSVIL